MYVTPIRLGLISRTNQIATSESTLYGGKICFRFENGHLCFTVKQEEVFTFGVISAFRECILGSFM